jgi:hypothetical protein
VSFDLDAAPPLPRRDLVGAALELVERMGPEERAAFETRLRCPVRLVGAERPAALERMHDARDFAGDP